MPTALQQIKDTYKFLIHDLADPRTNPWFLVGNIFPPLLIIGLYIGFVTKWGPAMMKNRKPFELKKVMIVYNIFQICVNAFLFEEGFRKGYGPYGEFSFWCQAVDESPTGFGMYTAQCCYVYYLLKILDLFDTVFMVLRKKSNHISFLHVYHHAGMVPLTWAALNYYPGGHACFFGFVNTFVHTVMYSYYLLTAISPPQDRHKLGWKRYLTLLQLVQFIIIGVHMCLPLFQPDCGFPKFAAFLVCPQVVFMVLLFSDFYIKAYIKTRDSKRTTANGSLEPKLNGVKKHENGIPKLDENKNKIS